MMDKQTQALADALLVWSQADMSMMSEKVLQDAIRQATKPETIAWLAAIAERYGFKPPETT